MMKLVKGLILTMYLIVYAYSSHMAIDEPNRLIWGWFCVIVFGILCIWGVSAFTKHQSKDDSSEETN